jgi:4'-phosphopantetheinyl transferase
VREGEVDVWWLRIDRDSPYASTLSADELQRAADIKAETPRRRFVSTRASLRHLLGRYLDLPADELVFGAGANGKPRLPSHPELRFNVSHSGALALIGVTTEAEVGVDVEQIKPRRDLPGLAQRFYAQAEWAAVQEAPELEAAFYRHWVAKESFVKATSRSVFSVRSFEVELDPPGGPRVVHVGGDAGEARRWTLTEIDLQPGYAAAVVVEGPEAKVNPPRELTP